VFGPRGPVDIVVNTDRPPDGRRQDLDGIKLAGQERRVGQVDQPAGGAVHRVSGTHDRQARDLAGAVLGLHGGDPQRSGDLLGPGRPADLLLSPPDRIAVSVDALEGRTSPRVLLSKES